MFSLFQRFLIVCFGICSLLYGISYGIHRFRLDTVPMHIDSGFAACELPCFAGLIPGRTPVELVPSILENSVPDLTRYEILYNGNADFRYETDSDMALDGHTINGTIYYTGQNVSAMHITGFQMPVSWLISQLGQPTCVLVFQSAQYSGLLINWQVDDVLVLALAPGNPIETLYTQTHYAQELRINSEWVACDDAGTFSDWLGFVPLSHYRAHQPY